jgi:hypothetical protein
MPGDRKLETMRDAFGKLHKDERELALNWMVGALSMHVTDNQWNELINDAVGMAARLFPKREPERSGKDASSGPDNN